MVGISIGLNVISISDTFGFTSTSIVGISKYSSENNFIVGTTSIVGISITTGFISIVGVTSIVGTSKNS